MDFKNKIILAPMAGVSDYAFRRIAREHGVDFCVSEMVSAKAMEFNDKKTGTLAEVKAGDTPIAVQIFGHPFVHHRQHVNNIRQMKMGTLGFG